MSNESDPGREPSRSMVYRVRIKGHLGPQWAEWFEGMTVTTEDNGDTLVTGPVADQAALHGLLRKIRDLGLPLLSVTSVQPDRTATQDGSEATEDNPKKEE